MEREMIVKFEEYLNKKKQKQLRIRQKGFMIEQFFIEKLMYKVQDDILSLRDEDEDVYLSLNLIEPFLYTHLNISFTLFGFWEIAKRAVYAEACLAKSE